MYEKARELAREREGAKELGMDERERERERGREGEGGGGERGRAEQSREIESK